MKTVQMYNHAPMFEMDFDERAIVISALTTFTVSYPQDETAKQMLHTITEIDLAMRIMARIESQEGCACPESHNFIHEPTCPKSGRYRTTHSHAHLGEPRPVIGRAEDCMICKGASR